MVHPGLGRRTAEPGTAGRVHLVVYTSNDTADEHAQQLCQFYRKAHYSPDLARQLAALEHEVPDDVAIVAYHKPWQHEPTRQEPR